MNIVTKLLMLGMAALALSACVEDGVYQTDYYSSTTTYVPAYPRYHRHYHYNYPAPVPGYGYEAAPATQTDTYITPGYYRGQPSRRSRTGQTSYYTPTTTAPAAQPTTVNGGYSASPGSTSATPVPPIMRKVINPAVKPLVPTTPTGGYTANPGN
jgi:hypothetical protein